MDDEDVISSSASCTEPKECEDSNEIECGTERADQQWASWLVDGGQGPRRGPAVRVGSKRPRALAYHRLRRAQTARSAGEGV